MYRLLVFVACAFVFTSCKPQQPRSAEDKPVSPQQSESNEDKAASPKKASPKKSASATERPESKERSSSKDASNLSAFEDYCTISMTKDVASPSGDDVLKKGMSYLLLSSGGLAGAIFRDGTYSSVDVDSDDFTTTCSQELDSKNTVPVCVESFDIYKDKSLSGTPICHCSVGEKVGDGWFKGVEFGFVRLPDGPVYEITELGYLAQRCGTSGGFVRSKNGFFVGHLFPR